MKPTYDMSGYRTLDLTITPVHVKEDGSIVAMVPMKWVASDPGQAMGANGDMLTLRSYAVTEWKEVQLAPPGTAIQPSGGTTIT